MDTKIVGNFLMVLRKENGWTQLDVAKVLNLSEKTISKWETGRGYPDVVQFPILAKLFNITVDEIINGYRKISPIDTPNEILNIESIPKEKLINSLTKVQSKYICKNIKKQLFVSAFFWVQLFMSILLILAIPLLAVISYRLNEPTPYFSLYIDLPQNPNDSYETLDYFVGETISFNAILGVASKKKSVYIRSNENGPFNINLIRQGSEAIFPTQKSFLADNIYDIHNTSNTKKIKFNMDNSTVFPVNDGSDGAILEKCTFTPTESGTYRIDISTSFKYKSNPVLLIYPSFYIRVYEDRNAFAFEGLSLNYDVENNNINNFRIYNSNEEDIEAIFVNPIEVSVYSNSGVKANMGSQSRNIINNYIATGHYNNSPTTILKKNEYTYHSTISLSPLNYYYESPYLESEEITVRIWAGLIINNKFYKIYADDYLGIVSNYSLE